MSFGFVIGPAIGGVLGGTEAGEASLFLPGIVAFLIAAGTATGTVFLLPESLPPEKRTQAAASHGGGKGPSLVELLRRPLMPQVLLLGFSVYVAMAMFETIFPFWAREQFNWGPREVGLSFTYLAVVVGIMQGFVVGRLAPRFGEGRLATVAIASYAVGLVWMTQAPNWIWMLVGVTLTSAGGGTFLTSMSSFVSKTAGANERGTVLGTYQSASWGGRALGPIAAGAFYNTLGHQSPLLAGAVIMLPCVALLAWITARSAAATERTV
jgi:MFS transporter, DHA1 family, tetracycline resistance protein